MKNRSHLKTGFKRGLAKFVGKVIGNTSYKTYFQVCPSVRTDIFFEEGKKFVQD